MVNLPQVCMYPLIGTCTSICFPYGMTLVHQALSFEIYWGALNSSFLESLRRGVVEEFATCTFTAECNSGTTIQGEQ